MRLFTPADGWPAVNAHTAGGGQALLILTWSGVIGESEPATAWLLDRDVERLIETARQAGMRNALERVMWRGQPQQHIDVRGEALHRLHRSHQQLSLFT